MKLLKCQWSISYSEAARKLVSQAITVSLSFFLLRPIPFIFFLFIFCSCSSFSTLSSPWNFSEALHKIEKREMFERNYCKRKKNTYGQMGTCIVIGRSLCQTTFSTLTQLFPFNRIFFLLLLFALPILFDIWLSLFLLSVFFIHSFFFVDFLLSNFLPISFCSFECLHTQMRIGKSLGYIFKIASIEMLKSITGENWIHVRVFSFFLLLLSSTLFSFSIDSFFLVFNEKEKSLSHWKIERILFQVYYHLFQSHEKVSSWFHFDQSHSMKRSD